MLTVAPPSRAIAPGGVGVYTIGVRPSGGFTATVNVVSASPSPSLSLELVPTSVIPPVGLPSPSPIATREHFCLVCGTACQSRPLWRNHSSYFRQPPRRRRTGLLAGRSSAVGYQEKLAMFKSKRNNSLLTYGVGLGLILVLAFAANSIAFVQDRAAYMRFVRDVTTDDFGVAHPGTVTFGNASAVDTTATFSATGSYTLRLTASDSPLSSSHEVIVTVADNTGARSGTFRPNTPRSALRSRLRRTVILCSSRLEPIARAPQSTSTRGSHWPRCITPPAMNRILRRRFSIRPLRPRST